MYIPVQVFCRHVFSFPLAKYLRVELLGHIWDVFSFIRNCHIVFPIWLHHFAFLLAMYKILSYSTSSSTLHMVLLYNFSQLSFIEAVFSLSSLWCWTLIHMLIGHLYIFGIKPLKSLSFLKLDCIYQIAIIFYTFRIHICFSLSDFLNGFFW